MNKLELVEALRGESGLNKSEAAQTPRTLNNNSQGLSAALRNQIQLFTPLE